MELLFLGTSSMVPTKERNHTALLLTHESESILLDCGEGTQRQLRIAGVKPGRIRKILITHWHGDHVFGLPGLLQTMSATGYEGTLRIFGPPGTVERFELLKQAGLGEKNLMDLEVSDVTEQRFYEGEDYYLEALPLEHTTPCIGYSFIEKERVKINMDAAKKLGIPEGPLLRKLQSGMEASWNGHTVKPDQVTYKKKGRKVSFVFDTALCDNCIRIAEGADVLVSEATYAADKEDKASDYLHLTARQAAMIANKAGAKRLVLTHFSQRYKDTQQIEDDARDLFDNVVCAQDFMRIKV